MIKAVKTLIEDRLNESHTSLPCTIETIDYAKGTCSVQPIPKRLLCNQMISYPRLIDVKLDFLQFGAWKFQFPRKKGDKVWVGFSETTIQDDVSIERFSLNEPYIIGSIGDSYADNSEDIILSGKGTTLLIKGDGTIELTTGANEMTINSNININGNLNIQGNTNQTGNISATGTVTGASGVTGNGLTLEGHTHKYYPGGGTPTDTFPPK